MGSCGQDAGTGSDGDTASSDRTHTCQQLLVEVEHASRTRPTGTDTTVSATVDDETGARLVVSCGHACVLGCGSNSSEEIRSDRAVTLVKRRFSIDTNFHRLLYTQQKD